MGDYRLYSDIESRETYFEAWGASTKHPDSMYCFSDYSNKSNLDESFDFNYLQWLSYIASNCLWSFHTRTMLKWILEITEPI